MYNRFYGSLSKMEGGLTSKNLIRDFDDFSGRNFFFCYLFYSNDDPKDIEVRYS